jgi:hypothetical protein
MKMKQLSLAIAVALSLSACGGGSSSKKAPDIIDPPPPLTIVDPEEAPFSSDFFGSDSATITNTYLPFTPGKTLIYQGEDERIEVQISFETKVVAGVNSLVVLDRAYEDGELVEETFDWYAQDNNGNVWYMGEESKEYEDGEVISTDGSWEAGKDIENIGHNATAGIVMKVAPFTIGDTYYQEFYETIAEDKAEIIAENVDVTLENVDLPNGEYQTLFSTLQTMEWVPLDDDVEESKEYKYFAPDIGLVLETSISGDERIELTEIKDGKKPNITLENFSHSAIINNRYFPLIPGTKFVYETVNGEDEEVIVIEVLEETRIVMGIASVVVRDRVYIDGDEETGILVEDTRDWFAQDNDGNVWYMGEDVDNYDEDSGQFIDHEGAWEAGVDGAQPGIQMKVNPRAGDSYYQEYLPGEAEDVAVVYENDVEITLENGETYLALKVKEWNPLADEDSTEYKYYAAGIGFIREEALNEAGEVEEGIEVKEIENEQSFEYFAITIENIEEEVEAQVIIEGSAEPDFFKNLQCYAPNGINIVDVNISPNSGDYADFQFDSATEELEELEASYPSGKYWCIASTPEGELLQSSATLSYEFVDAMEILTPENGAEDVPVNGLTFSWEMVEGAAAIVIDIENADTGDSIEIDLIGSSTSYTLPDDILQPGTEYEVGFEAIHHNGNANIIEDFEFTTSGDPKENDEGEDDENNDNFGDFENLAIVAVYNDTDDDTQLFIEAEAADDTVMLELTIEDSTGNIVHQVKFHDDEDLGITDVLYETSEPSLEDLMSQFPSGEYTFIGLFLDDDNNEFTGSGVVKLSYELLAAPTITSPVEDAEGISTDTPLTITWTGVSEDADGLLLEVEADESGETFAIELDTETTEFTLPAHWLKAGTVYVIDLEVIHENGNFTVVDVEFETEE